MHGAFVRVARPLLGEIGAVVPAVRRVRRDAARPGLRPGAATFAARRPRGKISHHTVHGASVVVAPVRLGHVRTNLAAVQRALGDVARAAERAAAARHSARRVCTPGSDNAVNRTRLRIARPGLLQVRACIATSCRLLIMDRDLSCDPVPQLLVHVDQALKFDTTQCSAQACSLHALVSVECGQAAPPFSGCITVRLRDCAPPPQDLVHVVPSSKLLRRSQSGTLAHCMRSSRWSVGKSLRRLAVVLRSGCEIEHRRRKTWCMSCPSSKPLRRSQSGTLAHCMRSSRWSGQAAPPFSGCITVRLRD